MSYNISTNAFIAYLTTALAEGGSETSVYISTITTLTGETLTTADLTTFGRGIITVEPDSVNMEFVSFTAVDSANLRVTGAIRGLSAKGDTPVMANKKFHPVGSRVIISFGIHNILDLMTYVATVVSGAVGTATEAVAGTTKLSVAAASVLNPIAVGDNDGRVPTQSENDALVGNNASIAVGTGNKFVTQTGFQRAQEIYAADSVGSDAYAVTLSPVPTAYVTGMVVNFKAGTANAGAATLNVNGLGAKTIVKNYNATLADNDIKSGQIVSVIYDGTNFQMLSSPGTNPTGVDIQTFTSSGTWTKPTGATSVYVKLWAAGGSGSKSNAGGNAAGGGGGGEYTESWFSASDLSSTETVTIGTGGTAISTNNTNGNDGGNSSFGSFISARGGKGGITNSPANDGTGGDGGSDTNTGLLSGIYGAGGVEANGGNGIFSSGGGGATVSSTAYTGGKSKNGGGGGGGASSSSTAAGGASTFGGAGGASSNTGTATSGSVPGGGGGAAVSAGNSGAGAAGKAIVITYL